MPETALIETGEAHNQGTVPAPNTGKPHLEAEDIAEILRLEEQGLTQQQIAASFNPPKHQSTISRCLREYGPDRTAQAKRMIRALSPQLALDIARSKDNKTKAVLLKGVNVLEEQLQSGVTVIVGGGGTVNIGVLSPAKGLELGEGPQK